MTSSHFDRPKWRKVVRILALSFTAIIAVVASGILLLIWSCTPPSLETLSRRFVSQRSDLEKIVTMSDQDVNFSVIDPGWLMTTEPRQYFQAVPSEGMPQQRWEQYRRLFRKVHLSQGLRRDPASGDIFLIVQSFGILDRGYSNGFLHCGAGPSHLYPACSSIRTSGRHRYSPGPGESPGYVFQRIAKDWYVYQNGPG